MAKDASGGAPTLEMVARRAGVSRATVSRVVNGSPKVSPEVVSAVNAAVAELRYVPNRAARSLARRSSSAIALIVPEDVTVFFGDPYFAAVVQGIMDRIDDSEYVLNLLVASADPQRKTRGYLESGVVDGAIVISHHAGDELFEHATVPLVYGGRPSAGIDAYVVDVDNVEAAVSGTAHLIEIGRRRIGTISGPLDMPAGIDRLEGFRRAVGAAGLPDDLVETGDFTAEGAAAATRRLLDRVGDGRDGRPLGVDALFVASDLMATGALAVLAERGLRVPEDIAIVGFDDSPAALRTGVPLTTVAQPSAEQGGLMAELLIRLIEGDETVPKQTILPTRLVLRDSA
ncbi:LacI family DNA-binding transcriptional regulator [Agromyces sp. NBRC 114283]|uniref:LacI family DNA-binding transcriptional regulator n=1 Tax=Agromyces sp. NBRC 114283 TaxID=2994521 RepID=UPI0024A0BE55|nr:LacI family DNA-binding transcriptional regulator [Agromyces sp. NBRC 114283]GLU87791.1 LacI family transcriptional regulator [Agromyces sp. NBRC 114283]